MTTTPEYFYLDGQRLTAVDNSNDGTKTPIFAPANITSKIREAFETYNPNTTGSNWTEVRASGDLVYADGNSAAASYLVVSKDPLAAGQQTTIESAFTLGLPVEFAFGVSMSQRTLGQEFSIEIVDTATLQPTADDLAIASITQTTTTMTVETVLPHGLSVGASIGIRDCSNQAANYPAVVVAQVLSPTVFTITAGPGGTIASQTITNPTGAKGFVFARERLGRAQNGISQIFENATVTNASLYIRSESGDALPSGTIAGNHSATIATTASVALVNAPYQYAWSPTTEYRMLVQSDRTQWADAPVDTTAAMTSRLVRTQICPDPAATYELRIRAVNSKSLTVPNAQIVSAVKTGTTTATITTDVPHGLVTNDLVVIYGIRAQGATEFPNLVTATAVTVTGANTFTVVIGTAGTVTSYGGYVAKVQGGNLMSALGAVAQVVQSFSMQTQTDGTRQLILIGSATWAGLSIGDLVNLVGVRDNVTGATLSLDGVWKVANLATTALTLVAPSSRYTPTTPYPANTLGTTIGSASNGLALPQATITVASTAGYPASGTFWAQTTTGWQLVTYTGTTATTFTGCTGGTGTLFTGQPVFGVVAAGGAVIRRTDLRISFLRLFDYERERVELLARPSGDIAASVPVTVNNTPAVTVSSGTITTVSTVTAITGGGAAEDAAAGANPLTVGGVVRTAVAPTTLVAGDAARLTMTTGAAAVVAPYSVPEVSWQTPAPVGGIVNTATPFQFKEAAGASLCNYVTSIDLFSEALTNATDLRIREPDLTCTSQTIASNTLTVSVTHNLRIGDAVVFTASTVTGISTGVTYFVLTTPAATTITLSATRGGATLTISGTGVTATFHKVLWQQRIPTTGATPRTLTFPVPLRGSINTAMQLQTATASGAGAVFASLQGFAAQ